MFRSARVGRVTMEIMRNLRVVKWLATVPAVGVCTLCNREFRVPTNTLRRAEASTNLRAQFNGHTCSPRVEIPIFRTPTQHQ